MIPLSPLQLKSHSFTQVALRARPNGSTDAPVVLEPKVQCEPDREDPNCWHLALTIKLRDALPDKPFVYEGQVQIIGVVKIHDVVQPDKREQIVRVNGISLLFSAAREMLLNLSARSVHGPISLPVVNFSEFFATSIAKPSELSRETTADQEHREGTPETRSTR